MKKTLVLMFAGAAFPLTAAADSLNLKSVADYCHVLDRDIATLATQRFLADDDMRKHAVDKPKADATKFADAKALYESVTKSLTEEQENWQQLGCASIVYPKK